MTLDHHMDLTALALKLEKQGGYEQLVSAIQKAVAIGSIRDDLRHAASSLRIVRAIGDRTMDRPEIRDGEDDEAIIVGALFTSAIILYSRATFASKGRSLGDEILSPANRATHEEVKMLRNTTFAHFGLGDDAKEGPIVREAVVRSFNRTQYRYGVYTTRAHHKVELGARMEALIGVRLDQVAAKQQKLFNTVEARLSQTLATDEPLRRSLPSFKFDVDKFSVNPTAANHMRTMLKSGDVKDAHFTTAVSIPDAKVP